MKQHQRRSKLIESLNLKTGISLCGFTQSITVQYKFAEGTMERLYRHLLTQFHSG